MANQTILKTLVLNIDAILSLLQDETGSDDLKNQFASIKENVIQRIASAETSKNSETFLITCFGVTTTPTLFGSSIGAID